MPGVRGRSGGRNKKSLQAHLLTGSYRPDRHGALALVPEPGSVAPTADRHPAPPGLSAESQALWEATLDAFEGWTPLELSLFLLALEQLDLARQCRERIDAEGIVLGEKRGSRKAHPLLKVERGATMSVLALFRQLNLGTAR